jgi:hypothetical protein
MVAGWNSLFFLKHQFHILHFPNSTGLFTKQTGRHYTKYQFSPDIGVCLSFVQHKSLYNPYNSIFSQPDTEFTFKGPKLV